MTSRFTAIAAGFLILTLMSGCTLLPERPTKPTFMLPGPELAEVSQAATPLTLRVLTPQAESPLNGTRILVNPEGHAIQVYGGARWSKLTPALVRDHWIEGLRQSKGLKAVIGASSNATSTLSLGSDLTRFQIEYSQGQAEVVIQLDAQLLESGSNQVLAAQRFLVQQAIDDKPVESIIAGFGAANQLLTEQLVAWVLRVSRGIYQEKGQARPLSDTESSTTE